MKLRRSPARTGLRIAAFALPALLATVVGLAVDGDAPARAAGGTTYYLDCQASSNGGGTSVADPWQTLSSASGHGAFHPGDRILLKRGTTCTGSLHIGGSGAAGMPITIGAYGSGALPTIAADTANQTGAISLKNQSYITIQDLHVTNHGKTKEVSVFRSGVLVRNDGGGRLRGITLQRLHIDSVTSNLAFYWQDPRQFGGISVLTRPMHRPNSGFNDLRILHNTITSVGRTGIMVENDSPKASDLDVHIGFNRVTRSRGDGIVVRNAINPLIDHNVAAQTADFWPCKQCGGVSPATANAAIWPANTRNAVIEYNEVYGTHKLGGDGEGIDVDMSATNTLVQYNYLHDNEGGGILFCGSNRTTARFNILQNNGEGQITFINSIPATNTAIYNNTIYGKIGNNAKTVRSFGKAPSKTKRVKGVSFYNNLVYALDNSSWFLWPTTPSARTNTYVGVHGIGEPRDVTKGYVSPGLKNPGSGKIGFSTLGGYKTKASVYYMKGSPIPKSITKDFFGKTINPLKPPRGAAG